MQSYWSVILRLLKLRIAKRAVEYVCASGSGAANGTTGLSMHMPGLVWVWFGFEEHTRNGHICPQILRRFSVISETSSLGLRSFLSSRVDQIPVCQARGGASPTKRVVVYAPLRPERTNFCLFLPSKLFIFDRRFSCVF